LHVRHTVRAVDHGQLLPDDPARAGGRGADRRLLTHWGAVPGDPAAGTAGPALHDAVRVPDRVGRVPLRADLHLDDGREDDPGGHRRVHGPLHDGLRPAGRGRHPGGDPARDHRRGLPALHRGWPGLRGGEGMSEWRDAVYRQPANLAAAAEAFADAIAELDLETMRHGTIVFAGIGASSHALVPAVLALRAAGRRAFALQATELDDASARELADAFVLVSQSGASTETVAALERIQGVPMVAISARGDSPLAEAADAWLPLGPEPDTPVATLSYTATLQALGMLCDALLNETGSAWSDLPALAEEVLAANAERAAERAGAFAEVTALEAVGGGPGLASARETALLAREALRLPATAMDTREYLHGPLEAVAPGFGAVVFGRERERALAESMSSFGAEVLLVGDRNADVPGLALPEVPPIAAPILQILPVQLLVDAVADRRGLTIGELRRHQDDTKVA